MKLSWAQLSPPGPWSLHHCGKACVNRGDILYIYIYTHTHTHIADSLCCIAEANTTLHSNYMPMHIILNTKKKKKKEGKAPVPPSACTKSPSSYPPSSLSLPSGRCCWRPPGDEMVPGVLTHGQCAWAALMAVCPHLLDRVELTFKKISFHILCCSIIMSPDFFGDGPLINKCASLVPHTWKKFFSDSRQNQWVSCLKHQEEYSKI